MIIGEGKQLLFSIKNYKIVIKVKIRKTNSVHRRAAMGATVGQMLWAVS